MRQEVFGQLRASAAEAKKQFGQNFLHDQGTLDRLQIVIEQHIQPTLLEIGPGLGALTERLLRTSAERIIALETDRALAQQLQEAVEASSEKNRLEIRQQDARTFDYSELESPYALVSNLPFNVGTFLLRAAVESAHPPEACLVILQKEVVDRILVRDGKWSLLALAIQRLAKATKAFDISRGAYTPAPNVDTSVLLLERRETPLVSLRQSEQEVFFRLARWAFSQKRKQLANSLAAGAHLPVEEVRDLLEQANVSSEARPETLDPETWGRIFRAFSVRARDPQQDS